jgi:nicotinamidase/pyrazinamidase
MNALILVDLQNDFLPGGALPVPNGDAVIPLANQLQGAFKLVVATQDWHPPNHSSFAANHSGRKPGETVQLKKRTQTLWPVHCVQSTHGAEFAPALMRNRINKVFKKGTDADIDSYSGFFDNGHRRDTGLGTFLKEKKVTEVYVLGLATDYCVKFTALDAVELGFNTWLVEDACRGVNLKPNDSRDAIEAMEQAGVKVISSKQLLSGKSKK